MRRVHLSTRSTQSHFVAFNRAIVSHLAAGWMMLLGCTLSAQTNSTSNYPVSAITMSLGDAPVSSTVGLPIVDATYNAANQATKVRGASYWGDLGYQALQESECQPGAYGCTRCDFTWYVNVDFVGFQREGDRRFSLTQAQFMSDPEYALAGRATIGRMCDCATAYEFVYTGPFEWTRGSELNGNDNVNSRFFSFPDTLDDAFNFADQHTQRLVARASSYELNKRHWAWDAVSTLLGIRYFNYEERYDLNSVRSAPVPPPLSGQYSDDIENHFIGGQIGGDVFFATSLKTSISLKGKAGVYANFATREVRLIQDGAPVLFNGVDKVDLAGLGELGIYGNYQMTPSIRISGGYEVWYIPGTATVARQNPHILSTISGTRVKQKEDLFLHGFSAGVQLLY